MCVTPSITGPFGRLRVSAPGSDAIVTDNRAESKLEKSALKPGGHTQQDRVRGRLRGQEKRRHRVARRVRNLRKFRDHRVAEEA